MKRIADRLFLVYCLLWLMIRLLRWIKHPIPWLNDYLTDFLFIPVVAHISLSITRRFIIKDESYQYPLSYLLFMALYASLVFEYLMPALSVSYIEDKGDIIAYFAGGIYYYLYIQKLS